MSSNIPPRPKKTRLVQKNANGQGTIYWSQTRQRWVAQFSHPNNKRPCGIFKLKKDAQDWIEEQKRLLAAGQSTYVPHPKMTVQEFLNGWLELKIKPKAPETYRNYQSAISRINKHIGNHVAAKLSPHAVEQMLGKLKLEYPNGENTIVNTFAVLRAAYRYAVKMGDFPNNPVERVEKPQRKLNPLRHIPTEDFTKIYQAAALHPYSHARVELGAIVGPRPGEILGLKWSDIDWTRREISISRQLQRVKDEGLVFRPVKQKTNRVIPLTDGTIQVLLNHKTFQDMSKSAWVEDLDLIFPNTIGRPLDPKRDRKWWIEILKRAGVRHYTLYQLRKTAYTLITSTGTGIPTILAYTGHSNFSTVARHYAFSTEEGMSLALQKLDALRPVLTDEEK